MAPDVAATSRKFRQSAETALRRATTRSANGRRWPPRPGAVGQRPGELADEERVPAGHVGDLARPVFGDADIDDQRKLGANILLGEATQVQPRCAADPNQTGEVVAQPRLWFHVAGSHNDHQRQIGDSVRDVPHSSSDGSVRPVRVVHDHDRGALRPGLGDRARDVLVAAEPFLR